MNTQLAARKQPVDILFTSQSSKPKTEETAPIAETPLRVVSGTSIDVSKLSLDVYDTSGRYISDQPTNISMATVNLMSRIMKSEAALWRNPTRTRTSKWGRREMMHVFNGWFRQSMTDYERYETFGRYYTSPDPFRNDDPPWIASFCR